MYKTTPNALLIEFYTMVYNLAECLCGSCKREAQILLEYKTGICPLSGNPLEPLN